jgi:hypothetical protein
LLSGSYRLKLYTKEIVMALFRLGPSGGLGGNNSFDDFIPRDPDTLLPPDNSRVFEVRVAALAEDENANPDEDHFEVIHGIQVEHIVDNPADAFNLEPHGLSMPGRTPHPVRINRGEHIKRITGSYDRFVNRLTITTAFNSSGDEASSVSFGKGSSGAKQFNYEAPPGFAIVGFWGQEGTLIDAIGVILRPLL